MASARVILSGIEMVYMMRKGQAKYACRSQFSLAEQFNILAAEGLRTKWSSFCPHPKFATEPRHLRLSEQSNAFITPLSSAKPLRRPIAV
jgi:hypothetical protein